MAGNGPWQLVGLPRADAESITVDVETEMTSREECGRAVVKRKAAEAAKKLRRSHKKKNGAK